MRAPLFLVNIQLNVPILEIGCMLDRIMAGGITASHTHQLTPLTAPKTNGLSVLLELGNQGIAMLHHIRVLLVLVVGAVRLNDAVDTVNGARNAVAGDELGKVPRIASQ